MLGERRALPRGAALRDEVPTRVEPAREQRRALRCAIRRRAEPHHAARREGQRHSPPRRAELQVGRRDRAERLLTTTACATRVAAAADGARCVGRGARQRGRRGLVDAAAGRRIAGRVGAARVHARFGHEICARPGRGTAGPRVPIEPAQPPRERGLARVERRDKGGDAAVEAHGHRSRHAAVGRKPGIARRQRAAQAAERVHPRERRGRLRAGARRDPADDKAAIRARRELQPGREGVGRAAVRGQPGGHPPAQQPAVEPKAQAPDHRRAPRRVDGRQIGAEEREHAARQASRRSRRAEGVDRAVPSDAVDVQAGERDVSIAMLDAANPRAPRAARREDNPAAEPDVPVRRHRHRRDAPGAADVERALAELAPRLTIERSPPGHTGRPGLLAAERADHEPRARGRAEPADRGAEGQPVDPEAAPRAGRARRVTRKEQPAGGSGALPQRRPGVVDDPHEAARVIARGRNRRGERPDLGRVAGPRRVAVASGVQLREVRGACSLSKGHTVSRFARERLGAQQRAVDPVALVDQLARRRRDAPDAHRAVSAHREPDRGPRGDRGEVGGEERVGLLGAATRLTVPRGRAAAVEVAAPLAERGLARDLRTKRFGVAADERAARGLGAVLWLQRHTRPGGRAAVVTPRVEPAEERVVGQRPRLGQRADHGHRAARQRGQVARPVETGGAKIGVGDQLAVAREAREPERARAHVEGARGQQLQTAIERLAQARVQPGVVVGHLAVLPRPRRPPSPQRQTAVVEGQHVGEPVLLHVVTADERDRDAVAGAGERRDGLVTVPPPALPDTLQRAVEPHEPGVVTAAISGGARHIHARRRVGRVHRGGRAQLGARGHRLGLTGERVPHGATLDGLGGLQADQPAAAHRRVEAVDHHVAPAHGPGPVGVDRGDVEEPARRHRGQVEAAQPELWRERAGQRLRRTAGEIDGVADRDDAGARRRDRCEPDGLAGDLHQRVVDGAARCQPRDPPVERVCRRPAHFSAAHANRVDEARRPRRRWRHTQQAIDAIGITEGLHKKLRLPADAGVAVADRAHGARIAVVTLPGPVEVHAAGGVVAAVLGADLAVVTFDQIHAGARPQLADEGLEARALSGARLSVVCWVELLLALAVDTRHLAACVLRRVTIGVHRTGRRHVESAAVAPRACGVVGIAEIAGIVRRDVRERRVPLPCRVPSRRWISADFGEPAAGEQGHEGRRREGVRDGEAHAGHPTGRMKLLGG